MNQGADSFIQEDFKEGGGFDAGPKQIESFLKVVGIHTYNHKGMNKQIKLDDVGSQPHESVRLLNFIREKMHVDDSELLSDIQVQKDTIMPQDDPSKYVQFSQDNKDDQKDYAYERIWEGMKQLIDSARGSQAEWKVIVLAITGHGYITYPAKESCILVPSLNRELEEGQMELRYINLEHFARHCAQQEKTITIIIDNACRVLPKGNKANLNETFVSSEANFKKDTDGTESNNYNMPGLAVLLFAAKKSQSATDKGIHIKINTGTENFINKVNQCIEQRQFGLEFLNLYPESHKIFYSNKPISHFKNVKLFQPSDAYRPPPIPIPDPIIPEPERDKRQLNLSLQIHQQLKQQYDSRWQRDQNIKERKTGDYPARPGLLSKECIELKLHEPVEQEWGCQGNIQKIRCMSMMGHIAKGARPEISFYQCGCFLNHRICEACYIYFQKMESLAGQNQSDFLGKVLVLPRPQHQCLISKFYAPPEKDAYYCYHPKDRKWLHQTILMTPPNHTKAFFPTVIQLDKRFVFVVGGSKDKVYQPGREVEQDNLVLLDTVIGSSRVILKKDLKIAVIHAACSIFDKKLLFIAGGMKGGQWISDIQIFDIEKCQMYKIMDRKLENFNEPLSAPSMSAEFFDRLGLIICGQNQEGETELRIFNSKANSWSSAKGDQLSIDGMLNSSFMALKLFLAGPNDQIHMILLGGMNYLKKKERNGKAVLYEITQKGGINVGILGDAILKGKAQDPVSDYFPQNQWITTEENQSGMPTNMYVLGRNGVYNIGMTYQDKVKENESNIKVSLIWADEGFNKHHDKDMD